MKPTSTGKNNGYGAQRPPAALTYLITFDREEYCKDYAAQFIIGLREMHRICPFLFDTQDSKSKAEALDLTRLLINEAACEGYGEYRTHHALMDDVMATFNWGGGVLHKFHETLKDALDPESILAPGKSGIWGKRFRGRGL